MKAGVKSSRKRWKKSTDKILIWQVLLFITGVLAVAVGIYRDEIRTVLMKAIYICLECIGIG